MQRRATYVLLAVVAAFAVAACGSNPTPAPSSPALVPGDAALGDTLFLTIGCAVCHGQEAQGSAAAPALAGHSAAQVKLQVRDPVGRMPAYGPERVPEQELAHLVAFIVSIEGEDEHGHPAELPDDDLLLMHLNMALVALETDDAGEAGHHLLHGIAAASSEVARILEDVLAATTAGALHDAEHELQELLADAALTTDAVSLHLRLAAAALGAGESDNALHHLEHFTDAEAGAARVEAANDAAGHIRAGELHDAEHGLDELLAGEEHHHE